MMGRGHAISGGALWLAGCAVASAAGQRPSLAVLTVGTAVCAGAALAPDVDHPNSTVARSVGPISRGVAWAIAQAGIVIHAHTRSRLDRPDLDGHRTITHTALWALLSGLVAAALGRWGGPWAAAVLVFMATQVGVQAALPPHRRRIRVSTGFRARFGRGAFYRGLTGRTGQRLAYNCRRLPVPVPTLLATVLAVAAYRFTPGSGWWLGLAVGLGSFIHCLGDSLTNSACPILAPLPVPVLRRRGDGRLVRIGWRVWYPVGPPRVLPVRLGPWTWRVKMRFDTGGPVETDVVQPLLTMGAVVSAVVVAWPELSVAWDAVWSVGQAFGQK